jgi:homoserine dehydrogenase
MRELVAVLKFGSSVLRCEDDLPRVVDEIYRWVRGGHRVVAVVSALGRTTDELFAKAKSFGESSAAHAVADLVAIGETMSSALLGLALDRAGIPCVTLDANRIGLEISGPVLDASPHGLNTERLVKALADCPVAIVPGYIGCTEDGRTSLLGRGGSDLTALFIAHQVNAGLCRLIKDVDGLYESDPAESIRRPSRYRTIRWEEALELGGDVVQPKAIQFAQVHQFAFEVAALNSFQSTLIGPKSASFYSSEPATSPLKIGLLGLGTVGAGVYQSLSSYPQLFEITGVAVRDVARPERAQLQEILTTDPWEVVNSETEVIIELIGGEEPARSLIAAALRQGKHVVTANKLVLAKHGAELLRVAEECGATLRYSAAVGGAVPMLEFVQQLAESDSLQSVHGVLNGTCNFVLDEMAVGAPFSDAVAKAQACGFAEADPTLDLDGTDTAQKLVLLARHAFGTNLHFDEIEREGILNVDEQQILDLASSGKALRLVAELTDTPSGLSASVCPQVVEANHPFAQLRAEQNCLICETVDGRHFVLRGRGAGRWPTTVSVIADVLELVRELSGKEEEKSLVASGSVA